MSKIVDSPSRHFKSEKSQTTYRKTKKNPKVGSGKSSHVSRGAEPEIYDAIDINDEASMKSGELKKIPLETGAKARDSKRSKDEHEGDDDDPYVRRGLGVLPSNAIVRSDHIKSVVTPSTVAPKRMISRRCFTAVCIVAIVFLSLVMIGLIVEFLLVELKLKDLDKRMDALVCSEYSSPKPTRSG